jgi:putative ABC transport system permease protein
MVQTHKVQIGIFRSLGVPDRVVLFYFASIGMMVATLGVILGFILSVPLNIWFLGIVKTFFGFPIMVYTTKWSYYLTGAVISLAICFACTLIPAWSALRIKPVDAIQAREGITKRKVGRIATKVGRKGDLPTPLKMTIRNILRKPGRSITSVMGIGLSLSLFLSFMIIMETMVVLIDEWNGVNKWDYEVEAEGFYLVNMTQVWMDENPEITDIDPAILLPTKLHDGGDEVLSIVYALQDLTGAYEIELEEGEIRSGEIVISFYHRDELGIDVGDTIGIDVPVMTPGVGLVMTRKQITVCGVQDNHLGYYAFMDLGTLQDMTNLTGLANVIFLGTSDGARSIPLENSLIKDPGVSSVTHSSQIGNIVSEYFDLFMGVVYAISIISTALAAAIIYNLFMISAHEKRRDYATMKTLGTSLPRLARLIFLEAFFITVPGILLGIVGGWGLAYYMLKVSMTVEGIAISLRWSWIGFFAGTMIMVVTVFIVSLITIRYISKIVIANVIRERSTG